MQVVTSKNYMGILYTQNGILSIWWRWQARLQLSPRRHSARSQPQLAISFANEITLHFSIPYESRAVDFLISTQKTKSAQMALMFLRVEMVGLNPRPGGYDERFYQT